MSTLLSYNLIFNLGKCYRLFFILAIPLTYTYAILISYTYYPSSMPWLAFNHKLHMPYSLLAVINFHLFNINVMLGCYIKYIGLLGAGLTPPPPLRLSTHQL